MQEKKGMPAQNSDVASILQEFSDILEIEGANQYRVRAYRTAAQAVRGLPHNVRTLVQQDQDLTKFPGIGKEMALKIREIVNTGNLEALQKARERVSPELVKLMYLQSLGPKRVKALNEKLGINSIQDLQQAAEAGKIAQLPGFGTKTQATILKEIKRFQGKEVRFRIDEVEDIARTLVEHLSGIAGVQQVEAAGSFRRRKETVGDLDILVTGNIPSELMQAFVSHEDVTEILSHGETKSSVLLRNGLQVDLRFMEQKSFGAALHYFTGSKAHNIAVRKHALQFGFKINEYGVFDDEEMVAGLTEEEVYARIGLAYIEPELREDRGELEAAAEGKLPKLIMTEDLRGDLHVHSKATDGRSTLEELAVAARDFGYEYLGISDHTHNLSVVKGLDPERLALQMEEIDRINDKLSGIKLLKGSEVDILMDGSLDLPDWILKKLDYCICSVHTGFNLSRQAQTERILRAMDNPWFRILGHPSGRLIGKREPYKVDLERIIAGARDRGCILELNSQPDRLDLDDVHCKAAKEMGVKVAVTSDSHHKDGFYVIRYGLGQARRGWLEKEDVINTLSLKEFEQLMKR